MSIRQHPRHPTTDLGAARHFLFHDCAGDRMAWALSTIAIVPTQDRTLRPTWMLDAARRRLGGDPITVEAGHCPHVSQPRTIAEHLVAWTPSEPAAPVSP